VAYNRAWESLPFRDRFESTAAQQRVPWPRRPAPAQIADPGLDASWKIVNTSYMMYLAVLGSLIHGMTVPGSIEAPCVTSCTT
jgi:hypothetical protein